MRYDSRSGLNLGEGAHDAAALFVVALNEERGVSSAYDRTSQTGYSDPAHALRRVAGDARLAVVFKQIRAILGVSEMEMARRLGTDLGTVLDFESGAVESLPPWPVTAKLVERYAQMGVVDPAPILNRLIQLQTAQLQNTVAAPPPVERLSAPQQTQPQRRAPADRELPAPRAQTQLRTAVVASSPITDQTAEAPHLGFPSRSKVRTGQANTERSRPPSENEAVTTDAATRKRRRRRIVRSLLAASPVLIALGVFALLQAAPKSVYTVANSLPGVLGTSARGLVDVMALQTATFKDGLRWIDPGDPRLRKGDRLAGR